MLSKDEIFFFPSLKSSPSKKALVFCVHEQALMQLELHLRLPHREDQTFPIFNVEVLPFFFNISELNCWSDQPHLLIELCLSADQPHPNSSGDAFLTKKWQTKDFPPDLLGLKAVCLYPWVTNCAVSSPVHLNALCWCLYLPAFLVL